MKKGKSTRIWLFVILPLVFFPVNGVRASETPRPAITKNEWFLASATGSGASARWEHAMAIDNDSSQVYVFGGSFENNIPYNNDLVKYNISANSWSTASNPGIGNDPLDRISPGLAYDSNRHQILLYGGYKSGGTYLNDVWIWDIGSSSWSSGASGPGGRTTRCLVFDARRSRYILFGGTGGIGLSYADTWAYDPAGNTWTNLNPIGAPPSGSSINGMVYDFENDQCICVANGETWVLDLEENTWTKEKTTNSPPAREKFGLAFDSARHRVLMYSGDVNSADTWVYDLATKTWWCAFADCNIDGLEGTSMVYDARNDQIVLFGGHKDLDCSFCQREFSGETWWLKFETGTSPSFSGISTSAKVSSSTFKVDVDATGATAVGLSHDGVTWTWVNFNNICDYTVPSEGEYTIQCQVANLWGVSDIKTTTVTYKESGDIPGFRVGSLFLTTGVGVVMVVFHSRHHRRRETN
ncbi:MAG: Kelch repeat-containing protein [Promethearchaeota archaeon]